MSVFHLSHLFRPSRVALVARLQAMTAGDRTLLANLSRSKLEELIVVDPGARARPEGLDPVVGWVPAVAALTTAPDLVVSTLPVGETPGLLDQLGTVGARSLIATPQRRVAGDDAAAEAVRAAARAAGVRMLGLNSFGVVSPAAGLNASRFEVQPQPGGVALISQSGSLISTLLDMGRQRGIGFSHVVSLGSLLDVDFGDAIDHLAWEPEVRCLMLYVENLVSVKKFLSACRAAARVRPIVAVRGGSSPRGRDLIAAHTGRLSGEDRIYDTAFRRAGIIRVDSVRELLTSAEAFTRGHLPRGDRLGVVTNSGGIAVLVADKLAQCGAHLTELSPGLQERLAPLVTYGANINPVCTGSDTDTAHYVKVLELLLESGEVDTVLVAMALSALSAPEEVVERLRPLAAALHVEMVYVWLGTRTEHNDTFRRLTEHGDVIYQTVEEAATVYGYARRYAEKLANVVALPPRFDHTLGYRRDDAAGHLAELEGARGIDADLARESLLGAYGLPVNPTRVVESLADATSAASELGYPVAIRAASRGTGYGPGSASVGNPKDLPGAYRRLGGEGTPVILQQLIRDARCDLRAGVATDVEFGPYLYLGTGGLLQEAPDQQAVMLPPLNRMLARKLIEHSAVARRVGMSEEDSERLEEILVRLSQLVVDSPAIRSLELNPLTLSRDGFVVQASRLDLVSTDVTSPDHLATAPYPNQYEFHETLKDGTLVRIRPIRPEDGESHYAFLRSLSSQTTYNRFFGYRSEISAEQMVRFTQIDYAREIAIVARVEAEGGEITIGVNRLTYDPRQGSHEFAVVVADRWQGSGIGQLLMEKIIAIAVDRGIRIIDGMILANNTAMLGLARKLGFRVVERDMETVTVRLER